MLHKTSSSFKPKKPSSKNNVEKMNNIVDLSHFFLFEAVEDSQGGMMVMGLCDPHNNNDDDNDDDDAESCSYDTWDDDTTSSSHVNDVCRGNISRYRTNDNVVIDNDNDDDDDDDNLVVGSKGGKFINDHKSTSEVVSTANSHNNSRKSRVDSNGGKKISENERNRLFWESCLAS